MIGRCHSQLYKKNSCSVKLQGGLLNSNSWKIPMENSCIINACFWMINKCHTSILFSLLQKHSSGEVSVKKVLIEISQNSQQNTCATVYVLIKLQACLWHRCFPVNFAKFLRTRWLVLMLDEIQNTAKRRLERETRIERKEIWKRSKRTRVSCFNI